MIVRTLLDSGVTAYILITLSGLVLFSVLILVGPGAALAPPVPMTRYKILFFVLILAVSLLERGYRKRHGRGE